jgi:hypothetical protein
VNRIRRALAIGTLGLQLLTTSVVATADERPRIAVVMDHERQPLAARIGTELGTMGFEAVVLLEVATSLRELAELTRRADAVAGAWISADEHGIRVWVVDRTTDKTLTRELPAAPELERTLALRAVELLRASLLELALPAARKGEREATPSLLQAAGVPKAEPQQAQGFPEPAALGLQVSAPPPAAPARALLALEIGPALIGASGDLGHYPALLVSVAGFVSSELSLGALAFAPLGTLSHRAAEGRSDNRITLLALEAGWRPASGWLRPFVHLGPTASLLRTRGRTEGVLLESASDTAITFGAAVRAGGALELSTGLALRPQGAAGVQQRYFSIEYAGRSAARWGAAWWGLSLTLEAQLFR